MALDAETGFVVGAVGPREVNGGGVACGQQGGGSDRHGTDEVFTDAVADGGGNDPLETVDLQRGVVGCWAIHKRDLDENGGAGGDGVFSVSPGGALDAAVDPRGVVVAANRGDDGGVDDVGEALALRGGGVVGFIPRLGAGAEAAVVVDADEQLGVEEVCVARARVDVLAEVAAAGTVPDGFGDPYRFQVVACSLLPFWETGLTEAGVAIEIAGGSDVGANLEERRVEIGDDVVVDEIFDDPEVGCALQDPA